MADTNHASQSGPFDGGDGETTAHRCKIHAVAVKIGNHGQTDGSAFSRLRLQKHRKMFPSSEALKLVSKSHDWVSGRLSSIHGVFQVNRDGLLEGATDAVKRLEHPFDKAASVEQDVGVHCDSRFGGFRP